MSSVTNFLKPPTECEIVAFLTLFKAPLYDVDLINLGTTSSVMYADYVTITPTEKRATMSINGTSSVCTTSACIIHLHCCW